MSEFRYKAFISYSHKDEAWARWLHRSIEAYKLPRNLVGSKTALGEVPARLKPIFRDRDELSSAADLGSTVTQALSDSENLIVICSPAAALSHWVKEEIREFVRLGRSERIFCVIVDGEASASGSIAEIFPSAIAEAGMQEPLAADVRKWADGKQLGKLKLISGMLGIPLDQLRRRELQKRRKTFALATTALVAVLAIVIMAVSARMSAQQRRDSGELLVGYKLNELRTMLGEAEDPEKLERLNNWDQDELNTLISDSGSQTSDLLNKAGLLRDEGIAVRSGGDPNGAMVKFEESWALFAEAYRRDRLDQVVFFELGQAEFWIGQIHLDRGDIQLAETSFLTYAEITRRLIQMQPKNADWVLEMAYALTNLGKVENVKEGVNPARTLQFMQSALEYNQIALVLDPDSKYYRSELGQSHAFLADAQRDVCDLEGELQSRKEGLVMETGLFELDSDNWQRQENLILALTGYGRIQAMLGLDDDARGNYKKALKLIELSARPERHHRVTSLYAVRMNFIIRLDAMNGRVEDAWAGSESVNKPWQELLDSGLDNVSALINYTSYLLDRAWLANLRGDTDLSFELLGRGMELLVAEATKKRDDRNIGNALTQASYRYWQIRGQAVPDNILALLPDFRAYVGRTRSCMDASLAVKKEVMLGNPAGAQDLVNYLLEKGFRESSFMQICSLYYSCSGNTDAN